MSEPLPEINVPTGTSRFPGFEIWFKALAASITVQGIEILNRAVAAVDQAIDRRKLVNQSDGGAPRTADILADRGWQEAEVDWDGRVLSGTLGDGTRVIPSLEAGTARITSLRTGEVMQYAGETTTRELVADHDVDGRIFENAIGPDGCTPQWVLDRWASRMNLAAAPGARAISVFGDSMTAAGWPMTMGAQLNTGGYPDLVVHERGVGGENSAGVAARAGAMPYLLTPKTNSIPASTTAVEVSLNTPLGYQSWPLLRGNDYPVPLVGTLAGVPGKLTVSNPSGTAPSVHQATDQYWFTRTTAGVAVTVNRPTPLLLDDAKARRGDVRVIWAGRNNYYDTNQVLADIRAMVEARTPQDADYLVMGISSANIETTGTNGHTAIRALNKALAEAYGFRFLDIRRYLIDYGLADRGITPTTQDQADIAGDTVPTSLRVDGLHLNANGNAVVADRVRKRLIEIGAI
jgi:hypothetical protein